MSHLPHTTPSHPPLEYGPRHTLEHEKPKVQLQHAAEWYYLACRSIGFAEHNGAYFKGETDVQPEAYFTKHFGVIDDKESLFAATSHDDMLAQTHRHIQDKRNLLETTTLPEQYETPNMTVCIPIAINSENPEMLDTLLQKISERQKDFDASPQVILWANAHTDGSQTDVQQNAKASYTTLRELTKQYARPDLNFQTALDIIPIADFSMSTLRQRFMDAFVGIAMEKGYSPDHVVTWLDADATMIGKDYFGEPYDHTHEDEVGFVHPRVDYTADWTDGKNKATYDDATRAFLANEIINRTMRNDQFYEYTEESGLSFTYLTFLLSGGCDTSNPVDESESLINSLKISTHMPFFSALQELRGDLEPSQPYDKKSTMLT